MGTPKGKRKRGGRAPSASVLPTLRRLVRYMRPHLGLLSAVLAAMLASTLLGLAPPWLIRYAIDRYVLSGRPGGIWVPAAVMLALSLLGGGLDFLRLYLATYASQRIIFDIRNALFEHLSRLSFSFYDRARTGDLMSRLTADVDTLDGFFSRSGVFIVGNLLTLIGILVVLATWDLRLALVYVLMTPLMAQAMMTYARKVRPVFGTVRRQLAVLTEVVQEALAGVQVVKLFGREDLEEERLDRQNRAYFEANLQASRISSLWMPYVYVLMGAGTGLVVWYGGRSVIQGRVSLGTLIGFTGYIGMLLRPIRQTGMMIGWTTRSIAAAERIFRILDRRSEVRDAPDAYELPQVEGWVRYMDVAFSYDGENEALRGVSLEAAPGQTVALVGPSGSGKTTLAHLLPRFYDLDEGRITIDGHDIRRVTVKSLRAQVGIALQDVFLFDASIRENMTYGNPQADTEAIRWAARVAQIDDFIESLPLGYGTPVGERGVRLSGGQRQRIALARVLLTDPRVLILDEPTSSVDAETERRLQRALRAVMADRTTFVIAHRLWTVRHADQILVMREGRIVERGTHEKLMAGDGLYKTLYDLQLETEDLTEGER